VLGEHTQYDDEEGSGEAIALLTCIEAKGTITGLLAALQAIIAILDGGVLHRHETGKPTWDAFDAMEAIASAAIAKATAITPPTE
jgi:hypothetical protein